MDTNVILDVAFFFEAGEHCIGQTTGGAAFQNGLFYLKWASMSNGESVMSSKRPFAIEIQTDLST